MPAPSFRRPEADFLRSCLAEWQRMKDVSVNKQNVDSLLRKRRQFIRRVTAELLSMFPDRDPSVSDPSPLTYSSEDLERLPERLRQWFRNNSRLPVDPKIKQKKKIKSRTHARNLAAKRYSQQIKEIAKDIREVDTGIKPMTAFNRATTRFMSNLKTDDPVAYDKLQQDAREIRGAKMQDYTELSPEALNVLLNKLPMRLLSDLEQYGKELPVHIWCIAAFAKPPSNELAVYTVCTPLLDQMNELSFDKTSRQAFVTWIQENLGVRASLQVDTAVPMIYPSLQRGARPSIPRVDNIHNAPAHELRSWLRTYFNYHYAWQGGLSSVPWKNVSQDKKNKYIPASCFPANLQNLISPNDMNRAELETWYQWLIDGQEGCLKPDQIFRFARIDRGTSTPIEYSNPITSRPELCKLIWGPEEKLFAAKVQKMFEDAQQKPSWNDLPLARLQLVYEPFSERVREAMSNGCLPEYRTRDLLDLLFLYERFGPVHTWRGGPFGIRWNIAVYVHFAASFSVYKRIPQSLPTDRVEAFEACHFSRLKEALVHLGAWLETTLEDLIAVLKETFWERAEAWREAVVAAHLNDPDSSIGNESLGFNTHGVPRSRSSLRSCYDDLQAQDPNLTLGPDSIHLEQLGRRVRRKQEATIELDEMELSDRESTSGEEIEMPSDGDEDEDDLTEEEDQEAEELLGDMSEIEVGLYQSQIFDNVSSIQSMSGKVPKPRDYKGLAPSPKPAATGSGSNVSQLHESSWEPSVKIETSHPKEENEDQDLPRQVLPRMSPTKIAGPSTPKKQGPRMVMEVVINTPKKKSTERWKKESSEDETDGRSEEAGSVKNAPGNRSIAQQRPRRSVVRSAAVEEAIRQTPKGKYCQ